MRYAYYTCLIIGQFIGHSLHSQYYFSSDNKTEPELLWELGASAGVMNYLTDIGSTNGSGKKSIKDINWNQTQFGGNIFAIATWHSLFAVKLQAAAGTVSGNDNVLKNNMDIVRNRYFRNLQFKTSIKEIALSGELYPLIIINKNRETPLLSAYIIAGIGFFNYNPQAWVNNTWVDMRPLHTEGEGFKEYPDSKQYKPFTWCIPVGAGI